MIKSYVGIPNYKLEQDYQEIDFHEDKFKHIKIHLACIWFGENSRLHDLHIHNLPFPSQENYVYANKYDLSFISVIGINHKTSHSPRYIITCEFCRNKAMLIGTYPLLSRKFTKLSSMHPASETSIPLTCKAIIKDFK